jgi:hypothetical protein
MMLWAVTCRDKSVRLFQNEEEAKKRAWMEDGDSEFDLPLEELVLHGAVDGQKLTEVWLCGQWLAFAPLPHNCKEVGGAYLTFREAQEAANGTKLKVVHATAELASKLASTDRFGGDGSNPPGALASQGIYKNAEDPDAAPKAAKAKKKRAAPAQAGEAGKKAVKGQ